MNQMSLSHTKNRRGFTKKSLIFPQIKFVFIEAADAALLPPSNIQIASSQSRDMSIQMVSRMATGMWGKRGKPSNTRSFG
jgi:hypothetical protein